MLEFLIAPRLSYTQKTAIRNALLDPRVKGTQEQLATTFSTTRKAIRRIQRDIREQAVFGRVLGASRPGPKQKVTPEIEARVIYILEKEHFLY